MTGQVQPRPHVCDAVQSRRVTVLEQKRLAPNVQLLVVNAPVVARKIRPGQFIIIRAHEKGERIPLTVADWDASTGAVSCIVMTVGASTVKIAKLAPGDVVPTFVGPLGKPLEVESWGKVALVGGCYGIGSLFPIARALKEKGNTVISLIEGRSKFLLYWLDRLRSVSDQVIFATRDRSLGRKKDATDGMEELLTDGQIQRVIAIGCTFLMYQVSQATRPKGVKTIVSLNPIMIDGTGMCGACRVLVGGKTMFACVDGPDFDGHEVDWDLMLKRRKAYLRDETDSSES